MQENKKKIRVDRLLVERGFAPTCEKARALIMAGCVLVDDVPAEKAGQLVPADSNIRVKGADHPYASRGGVKLAHALEFFGCDVAGRICMDVGASTGGFTDCLLQNGAAKVYAVDVGRGQLAARLAHDERVVCIDRTNIRYMARAVVPDAIEIAAVDVSFISLSMVLPAMGKFLARGATVIALVKPQFEVARGEVGRGGIVRDPVLHEESVRRIRGTGEGLGWTFHGVCESPVLGAKGNREFLVCFKKT